ncbi:MAG: hypothetical protein QF714_10035 [Dehalococcoidia bacterium]|jgi:hypothetical protein|nr:hypothetical protein [Dehalococcoidia bacterium]MDP6228019.1 hypothetical protein [Dehalococcoidia bacterium]MDP7084979.1 hypothetical protein [Dehalococcoidia bacterium]MDP7201724.1 hypothetical protein [Dehalococcoidia bacterium]MDP7510235.1 hypothetical protein [Dehalococcoidia bacterium]
MQNEQATYELRQTTLRSHGLDEYVRQTGPSADGGKLLCRLSGFIGYPPEEVLEVTGFPGLAAWTQAQQERRESGPPDNGLIEKQEVRLLRSISSLPKSPVPAEDRRTIYGYRRFFIRPTDLDDFVNCSENGIWPRIEAQDARILGLWTTLAATDPQEIILLTGYHGPGHWEETRDTGARPPNIDAALWDTSFKLATRRRALTIRSWVCLMRAVEVAGAG